MITWKQNLISEQLADSSASLTASFISSVGTWAQDLITESW